MATKEIEYKGYTIKMRWGKWRLDYHDQKANFRLPSQAKAFIDRMEPKNFEHGRTYKIRYPVAMGFEPWEGSYVRREYVPLDSVWIYFFRRDDGQICNVYGFCRITKKPKAK